MFSETVKNFMFGDVSGAAAQGVAGNVNTVEKSELATEFSNEVARILREASDVNDTVIAAAAAAAGTQAPVIADGEIEAGQEATATTPRDFSEEQLRQAHELMVAALETISELLGLENNVDFDLEHVLKLEPQSIEQLADILWGIDNAIKLLEQIDPETYMHGGANFAEIVGADHPLSDIKNAGELAEFMSQLRTARSHIGLALYTLELQDVVSEQVAQKHGESVTFGITQAANPADLGMSISDLATVFKSLIREEMTTAVERLRAIASGAAEMTELEKAALRMNTVESAILKASLANGENPLSTFDFGKVDLGTGANANVNANNAQGVTAQVAQTANAGGTMATVATVAQDVAAQSATAQVAQNATTATTQTTSTTETTTAQNVTAQTAQVTQTAHVAQNTNTSVPLSAGDVVNNNVENNLANANRTAQQSVDPNSVKPVAADTGVSVPLSVADQTQKAEILAMAKATEMVSAVAEKVATSATTGVEVPLSAAERVMAQEIAKAAANVQSVNANNNSNNSTSANANATSNNSVAQNVVVENSNANTNGNAGDNSDSADSGAKNNSASATSISANVEESVESVETVASVAQNATTATTQTTSTTQTTTAQNVDNANVNANQPNVNAAGQSTESGVGIAFANVANPATESVESVDIDSVETEDGVAKAEQVETKSAQAEKADKALPTYSRLEQEALIRQLTERMHYAIRNGAHEVRMILRPESMGEVRMSIRVQGDIVLARAQVENRQVKAMIESNMQSLKEELAKHNLNLDGFSVDVGNDDNRSPRQTWREMAEASTNASLRSKFKFGLGNSPEEFVQDEISFGTDTGRRFGSNTFEYFI